MKLLISKMILFLAAVAMAVPVVAIEPKRGVVTVPFASSGPGKPDGYENASIEIKYGIYDRHGGVEVKVNQVKGSIKASNRYWFEGEQVPATVPPPESYNVEFTGAVMYGGRPVAKLAFLGNRFVGDSGDFDNIGTLKELLGNSYTEADKESFFKFAEIWVYNSPTYLTNPAIGNVVRTARAKAKKEAEEAEREKQKKAREEEQARKEKERKETEEKEKQAGADEKKSKQKYADGDFWGTGSKSAPVGAGAAAAATGAGRYVRTTDGGYWWQGADGKNRQVTADEYNAAQGRESDTRRQAAAEETARKNEESSGKFFAEQQRRQDELERTNKMIDTKFEGIGQSFYAAEIARNARENIANARRLDGDYSTLEELDAAFYRQIQVQNQGFRELEEAQKQQSAALQQMLFGGGSATDQAVGDFLGAIANNIARSEREKEKEEARRELQAQREEAARQIEAKKRAAMMDRRRKLIAQSSDGNMPLSAHKVNAQVLYFFSYTFDKDTIENPNPQITLANTFPVARYGDGTWPYKHSINSDLRKIAAGENTLMGYYATRELADKEREAFIRIAKSAGFVIKDIAYAGRPGKGLSAIAGGTSVRAGAPDFWSKPNAEKKPVKSEDDFWK